MKKKDIYFSDLSPLKQAWISMWKNPSYTKEEVLALNKEFLKDWFEPKSFKKRKDNLK